MPSTSASSAVIIVDGDHVQVVSADDAVARALAGALPPDMGAWPSARPTSGPPDALALGGVARPQAPPASPPPHEPQHGILRADGGVAFVLYLAIGFASTLACIAALVGVFYVARAVAARNAADAARAAAEEGGAQEEVRPPGPPPKPTVVVVHPGGEPVGVGVEEGGWADEAEDDGEGGARPPPAPPSKSPPASPGKGTPLAGLPPRAPPPKGASPAALAVAALPDCQPPALGASSDGGGGFIRAHRPQSPAAAAVAAVTAAVSAAAAAAAAAAGVGGAGGAATQAEAPPPVQRPANPSWARRLRALMLARPPSPRPPPPPAVGEP